MSAINRSSHPFYDKHSELIRSLWTINKQNPNSDEKISQLKEVLKSANPNELCDIYDEKTGESRAKVPPLIIACFEGDFDTIKCLLDHGADPNQTETEHNLTAIHIIVDGPYKGQTITEEQRAELIKLLIAKGANVNQADKHKMSPVHKTVINDRKKCLEALIQADVDVNASFMGETALTIAARQNRDQIMKTLLSHPKIKTDGKSPTGGSILHISAAGMVDAPECVQLLVQAGVPINAQDDRGNTPLIFACFFDRPRIVKTLLDGNADVSIKNNEGKDALAVCEERSSTDCKQILEQHK